MNDVIRQISCFYENSIYYTDTDSLNILKKCWFDWVDNGLVGKTLGLRKKDYGNSGIFFAWFLAPKIEYCLVIDDFGVISVKRTFEGYSEEHRILKLDEFISLWEGKTVSGRYLIDWTKTFEGKKSTHRKRGCTDCNNGKKRSDCVKKPNLSCFYCEMDKACKTCLDLISQKKTYSTGINMSKGKPANEYYQILPIYGNKNDPKQNIIDFESAEEILLTAEKPTIEKRRFERIKDMISCKSHIKHEEIPENKQILIYGFKHIKTDKIDNFILVGCESDVLYENIELFNFWSKNFIKKEIEKKDFKITGWSFMTLVNKKSFFEIQSICFQLNTSTYSENNKRNQTVFED